MPTETGLDRHHEHLVELGQQFEVRLRRSSGLEGDACTRPDRAQAPCQCHGIPRRLGMEGDRVCTGFGIARRPPVRIVDHQVNVEGFRGHRLEALDHPLAEGKVRHKMVVHDVDVDEVGVRDPLEFAGEVRKVGGEDARIDAD